MLELRITSLGALDVEKLEEVELDRVWPTSIIVSRRRRSHHDMDCTPTRWVKLASTNGVRLFTLPCQTELNHDPDSVPERMG